MKSVRSVFTESIRLMLPLAILAFGVITFAAITSQRQLPQRVEREEMLPLVEVAEAAPYSQGLDIELDGVVVPRREITLSAEVSGRITHKSEACRAGRYVTQGTLLVEVDPRTYQLERDRLQEEVTQAGAGLDELDVEIFNTKALIDLAEEEATLRKRELDRYLALSGQNATSANSVDEARRNELTARNNLTTLHNQLRKLEATRVRLTSTRDLAETKLAQAELDLEKTRVRAPIDGVVVSESVEENSFVQPGTALCIIEDTSAAEVRCSLRMDELAQVMRQEADSGPGTVEQSNGDYHLPQTPVTVSYQLADRTFQWDGILWRFEGIGLDEKTRTVPCRVLVRNPQEVRVKSGTSAQLNGGPRALVRGMFVQLTIHTNPSAHLLQIPERSVQPGNVVWRVRGGKLDIVRLRDVSLIDETVLIAEEPAGLHQGDKIVTSPLPTAIDGMRVRTR